MAIAPGLLDLAIAIGLGLLVGLQREYAREQMAGLRTFALTTALGALSAMLVPALGGWIVAAAFVALGLLVASGHYALNRSPERAGLTTEVALLLMFGTGVCLVAGGRTTAIVLGGAVAVLLQAKDRFRWIVEKLGAGDIRAIIQFALFSLVILPALPDVRFGPFGVLNLFEIWLLVVLIVGINLGGYITYRFFGAHAGALLGGFLGGLISSTATAVSYARRSREEHGAAPLATAVIVISTAVVLIRIIVEIGVVAPRLLYVAAVPIAILFAVSAVIALLVWRHVGPIEAELPEQKNPTRPRSAIVFALLYAAVLIAVAWVQNRFGIEALYLVAAVAGFTDVDAITLSTARLSEAGRIDDVLAWRAILLAFLSNLAFKAGIVAFAGSRALLWRVSAAFGTIAVAGLLLMLYA